MKEQECQPAPWSARGPAPLWPAAAWRRFRTNFQPTGLRQVAGDQSADWSAHSKELQIHDRGRFLTAAASLDGITHYWARFKPCTDDWTDWQVCPTRSLPPPQPGCPAGDPGPLPVLISII